MLRASGDDAPSPNGSECALRRDDTDVKDTGALHHVGQWTEPRLRQSLLRRWDYLSVFAGEKPDVRAHGQRGAHGRPGFLNRKMSDRKMSDRKMSDRKMSDGKIKPGPEGFIFLSDIFLSGLLVWALVI